MHRLILSFLLLASPLLAGQGPHFASGVKVGEVTQSTAIVWVRLTEEKTARFDQLPIFTEGLPGKSRDKGEMPTDVAPGMAGEVQLKYRIGDDEEISTAWFPVTAKTDFVKQFQLKNLVPNSQYQFSITARSEKNSPGTSRIEGRFKTAPMAAESEPIRFIVTTCQAIRSVNAGAEGHSAYRHMLEMDPHFFVHTGDILYYDKAPLAKNKAQARAKWNLMFAYESNRAFHQNVSSYFMKDDHDTLKNDCWPGQTYGDLTFDEGLSIFREQVPMGDKTHRTVRWGKDVQIWMTENRDFRSPNKIPDGPEKTILGKEQKAWLMKTIEESDATYKFVISPGPLVGPDKKGKADNHANAAFQNEGQQLRDFLSKQKNTFVICGDRHWQYCSEDPKTGLIELGCGPINDEHSYGGNPGNDEKFHRYFSKKGGFLVVTIEGDEARADWHTAGIPQKAGSSEVRHSIKLGE